MRAGSACAAQQTLSAEAAAVLKHSLSLSRRRGHAQVTPLHVAATLLTSRGSLLRRACLKSQPPPHHHHPLQCRALELCFNVALNRLPATPGPLLAAQPSLSNALVAALKRAQAHQRRGCVEQQQPPPLIAVKVELEQLVLSILDDPSVSRVMREAGFSSAAVKNNLEDANNINSVFFQCYNNSNHNNSGGIYSTPNSPPAETHNQNHFFYPFLNNNNNINEDVKVVLEVLLSKKRKNVAVVGDSLYMAEKVVNEIMFRVERGDLPQVPNFIKFPTSVSLNLMNREEVEMKIAELKRKVDSFSGGSVIIYAGDLKWTVEIDDDEKDESYRPVDHLIAEMGKLLSWYNNNNNSRMRVWLMGIANYQTYMKCQMKQQPLDVHWALQAVSVPTGGLGLTLNATSGQETRIGFVKNPSQDSEKRPFFAPDEHEVLTCCPECKSDYEKEASFKSIQHKSFSSHSLINNDAELNNSAHLPFWLKPRVIDTLVKDDLILLRSKYNKLCQNLHKGRLNPNNPISLISNPSYLERDYSYPSSYPSWLNKNSNNIFADSDTISFANNYPPVKTNQTASSLPRFRRQQSCHIDFSFSNGTSKYQPVEPNLDSLKGTDHKEVKITLALGNLTYNDCTATTDDNENLVKLFQENMPWQSETVASILESLSAGLKANGRDKFILIEGNDIIGKRRLALGIAKFMFGSSELLFRMNMRENVHGREKLEKALRGSEKLVVLIEDVNYADFEFAEFLDEAYEKNSGCALFILTMGDEKSKGDVDSVIQMRLVVDHGNNKRKADWDLPMVTKRQRSNEIEQVVSLNALDLNVEADDQDEVKTSNPNLLIIRFLEKIKSRYVLNMDLDQEARAKDMFLSKLKRSFEEVNIVSSLSVEETVLDEVLRGSGLYLDSLFEEWLKEVFRTSLQTVDSSGEGEKVSGIRLCLGVKGEVCPEEDGFMGTCLPKSIQVSLTGCNI